ncbi:uncharacterized protein LOC124451161 [Xenia sp. Carnegie-2017]|uniref:uncharacterized protein LOC124451161 n=1 Tax=Xenia sp. Carnegie-2017 TaxID=2897299 RepID=UPI001F0348DE|nr:uncharacterized protein LOC124451161 [Xenia sp. Carnegie-2017]XP_046857747.1 uncharacterized protein LOC124451161 [Xenia sp. Carnegie-2017]XP_046857748.1 uncharacterized protein LOC124451161 [Xenia sp. Carnegie-2017]
MGSVLSRNKKTKGFKLMRLIVDVGGEALRITLRKQLSGTDLFNVLNKKENYNKLLLLKDKQIKEHQWDLLYPPPPILPNENKFDITLLCILLRNICGLKPPRDPIWTSVNDPTDYSTEADITRIRLLRNDRFAHLPSTSVSSNDFENFWVEISEPLVRLGTRQKEIDRLKNELFSNEECERILREWDRLKSDLTDIKTDQRGIKKTMEGVDKNLQQVKDIVTVIKDEVHEIRHHTHFGSEEDFLTENLVSCNFKSEIRHHYENFLEGTREWVFDEFLDWFEDDSSQNRAFIISAVAGMGKSVIAATLCKRYPQYLTAVHFFQHNNSRYNNANVLFQSIAMQVSRKFPAYKQLLEEKLSSKLSQPLNNMNVEGLFSLLFTELFNKILELPKRMLVVLDALDECDYSERDDLANLLANHLQKLPRCFRFVITTRPNDDALNKFEKLNPLYINCSDDRNLKDIKLLIEERIGSTDSLSDVKNSLAEKADGLMLLASLLSSEVKNQDLLKGSIPKDLSEYYKTCLTRLSKELLDSFHINDEMFQSILNTLAVAKEPLPLEMINNVLCLNSNRDSVAVRKIISCLFVTNGEGCVSFFHKSLNDWLLDDRKHDYSVQISCGHRLVLEFCLKSLDNLKAEGVNYDIIKHVTVRYSVKYWLLHLLDISGNECIIENVGKYLVDLEVLVASVLVDSRRTLENFKSFNAHDVYFLISEDIRLLFNEVYSVMTWSVHFDNKVIFLQNFANEVNDLSLPATKMLQTRFKDSPYLECRDTGFVKARLLRLFFWLKSVDVSRNHDYIVCGYEGFVVQLFSLRTNRCLWIKNISCQFKQYEKKEFCVAFHPFEDIIFASQLDKILDINGKISSSPFHCDDSTFKFFTNKCFSKDKYTMVTIYKDTLTVWDVKKGKEKRSIRCNDVVISLCFSNSGKYLCVIEKEKGIKIINVANNYEIFVYDDHLLSDDLSELNVLFTVGLHSWCCGWPPFSQREPFIVNPTGKKLPSHFIVNPTGEKLPDLDPNSQTSCFPLDPFDDNRSSFSFYGAGEYFILYNDYVILFEYGYDFYLYSIPRAFFTNSYSVRNEKFCSNGKFLYRRNEENSRINMYNLNTFNFVVKDCFVRDMVAVKNGVILLTAKNIPELWNNNLTKLVYSFDEIKYTNNIFKVSDVSFACQKADSFVFFNVENKRQEISVNFENYRNVHVFACSSKYHVFAKVECKDQIIYCMWHEDKLVHGWNDVIKEDFANSIAGKVLAEYERDITLCIYYAAFSPSADNLLINYRFQYLKVFDVKNKQTIYSYTFNVPTPEFFSFVDDRYIISNYLALIDLKCVRTVELFLPLVRTFLTTFYYCRKRKLALIFSSLKVPVQCVKIILPQGSI